LPCSFLRDLQAKANAFFAVIELFSIDLGIVLVIFLSSTVASSKQSRKKVTVCVFSFADYIVVSWSKGNIEMPRYTLPALLEGKCSQEDYTHWLYLKAAAHVKRDKKRGNLTATKQAYRDAIHKAVCEGGDLDAYNGQPLRWDLIRTYDNQKAKSGKRNYKKLFAELPTIDHEDDGMGEPLFKICSWKTNDCKNDLSITELIEFCDQLLAHQKKKRPNHRLQAIRLCGQRGRA
jgi:hypothetical protein